MIKVSPTSKATKPLLYHKLLGLLCWLKVIPVSRVGHNFKLISLPTALSTLWFWLPFSYYIYAENYEPTDKPGNNSTSAHLGNGPTSVKPHFSLDQLIIKAYACMLFLLILLLPGSIGYYFALNKSAFMESRFRWSVQSWLLVLLTIIFMLTQTVGLWSAATQMQSTGSTSTLNCIHFFLCRQLANISVSLLQFIAIYLVSARQADFIRNTSKDICQTDFVDTVTGLIKEYESISQGVGPFYALEFCIHTPITLCFAYFGVKRVSSIELQSTLFLSSIDNTLWSSSTIVHMCLMSENCYEALQSLVAPIR